MKNVKFEVPKNWDANHLIQTQAWVANLLKDANLKYLLTWYSLKTYNYTYNPKEPTGRPNIHTFTFKPQCKNPRHQLTKGNPNHQEILEYITQELNQEPFLDNAIEESLQYSISQDLKTIIITFKASE